LARAKSSQVILLEPRRTSTPTISATNCWVIFGEHPRVNSRERRSGLALATAPLAQQRAHIFHQQLKTIRPHPQQPSRACVRDDSVLCCDSFSNSVCEGMPGGGGFTMPL
jgi:hypothetical protein